MKFVILFAICAVLSEWSLEGVVAFDECRYVVAQRHYMTCVVDGLNDTGIVHNWNQDYLRDVCRRSARIQRCLSDYADGCVDGDLIVADWKKISHWCEDDQVADWVVDELDYLSEDFDHECVLRLINYTRDCVSSIEWVLAEDDDQTLADGMSRLKREKAALMTCSKGVFKEHVTGCSSLSWQQEYNIYVTYMATGPLGLHVGRSDLLDLEDDDLEDRQLKRANLPFPWLRRTNVLR